MPIKTTNVSLVFRPTRRLALPNDAPNMRQLRDFPTHLWMPMRPSTAKRRRLHACRISHQHWFHHEKTTQHAMAGDMVMRSTNPGAQRNKRTQGGMNSGIRTTEPEDNVGHDKRSSPHENARNVPNTRGILSWKDNATYMRRTSQGSLA